MPQVFLSLGSNVNREENISLALNALEQAFGFMRMSSVYQTAAVGFEGEDFYNLVVVVHTNLSVQEINVALKNIEKQQGRNKAEKGFAARKIDIDLVTYGDAFGELDGIELPRAEIHKYAFVLFPIVEIAGEQICPGTDKTFSQLWDEQSFEDQNMRAIEFEWKAGFSLPCTSSVLS